MNALATWSAGLANDEAIDETAAAVDWSCRCGAHSHHAVRSVQLCVQPANACKITPQTEIPSAEHTVSHHHCEVHAELPTSDLVSILSARPTTWLRAFLYVAARRGQEVPLYAEDRPWFRLREPVATAPGVVAFRFIWKPHLAGLFSGFDGEFTVSSGPAGCTLAISGRADDGDQHRTQIVLETLVNLLSAAASLAR
jgi:hypothetical protein